jgi:hypothetical protein
MIMVNKVLAGGVPGWKDSGDWFDVCKCSIPCPVHFAQAPTYGDCSGVLAYHIFKEAESPESINS